MKVLAQLLCVILLITHGTSCTTKAKADQEKATPAQATAATTTNGNSETSSYTISDSLADSKVNAYDVKLVEGKHKYGGYTKLKYLNTLQFLNERISTMKKQMKTEEEISSTRDAIKSDIPGGMIQMEIGRITLDGANTDMFTVIIKDDKEKEVYRKELKSSIPETPNGDRFWWNIANVIVPNKIRPPFFIYVVDRLNDDPFKFSVTAN
jgi:hypothetical protein